MPRPKADRNFLTPEDLKEFLGYVEENKITQTRMAEIQGVSEGTISGWLSSGRVLKALRDNVKCRMENPQLKEKLNEIKNLTGDKK